MKLETMNGLPVIKCSHVEAFELAAKSNSKAPCASGAAPMNNGIEIEPGILFLCCDWCAAHLREQVIKRIGDLGPVKITIEFPEKIKQPTLN